MSKRPSWLAEWRKRTRIIDIIEKAYTIDCNCEVCQEIRELGEELGDLFTQQMAQMPNIPGGAPRSQRQKRKR